MITVDLSGDWRVQVAKIGISLLTSSITRLMGEPDESTMKIAKPYRVLAQELANQNLPPGRSKLAVDGIIGPRSRAAFALIAGADWKFLVEQPGNRAAERLTAALFQKLSQGGLKLDGWWGPNTQAVADILLSAATGEPLPTRPDEDPLVKDKGGRRKVKCWRPTDHEMIQHYGHPGTGWDTFAVPYPLRLAWDTDTKVTRITMHRLVRPAALQALSQIEATHEPEEIEALGLDLYGGAANKRKKRGGSTWSAHAFGAAWDWDPDRNQLRESKSTARFARKEYARFRKAMSDAGFMSLGQCYDFDWMHWQLNPAG